LFDNIQPKQDAERAVIGAILVNPSKVMPEALGVLSEEMFFVSELRTLYSTCAKYFLDNKPIDALTLTDALGVNYRSIIAECIESMPSIRNWQSYAQIVVDTAKRKKAQEQAFGLLEALQTNTTVDDCQQAAVSICESLSTTKASNIFSAKEGFLQFFLSLQKEPEYIPTGIPRLDRYAHISKGKFVVIGARPSVGKTALTLQMMRHMAKTHKVAYFSLETHSQDLFERMTASIGRVDLGAITTRKELDYTKVARTQSTFAGLNFHIIEAAGWTTQQIKAAIVRLGAEVAFVDYMGLIKADGGSRYEKMTNISIDLHTIAQQQNVAIIALSQLSRPDKSKRNTPPVMEDLRESGQIEQDADVIMLLHAPNDNNMPARVLTVDKNKQGELGRIYFSFNGEYQHFEAQETRYGQ